MAGMSSLQGESPRDILTLFQGVWSDARIEGLGGAGGLSGAKFWRITVPDRQFCLRRWPREHPSLQRLARQHAVLFHAQSRGIAFVPVPLQTVQLQTVQPSPVQTVQPSPENPTSISMAGHLWELTPWMPGEADFFPQMETEKLTAAAHALARFHQATSDFPTHQLQGVAPAAQQRLELIDEFSELSPKIAAAIRAAAAGETEIGAVSGEILDGFAALSPLIRMELLQACNTETGLQPAIRDVRSDHILFQGTTVTGIVDFGAMRIDSIAVDIARLLGSMAGDDEQTWQAGLAGYQAVRPLAASELQLVGVFDRSSVVLSGMNWLRWLFVDGRRFEDLSAVVDRLGVIRDRLRCLIHRQREIQS